MFGSNESQDQTDTTDKKLNNPRMKTVRVATAPRTPEQQDANQCCVVSASSSSASDASTSGDASEVCDVVQSVGHAEDSALTASTDTMSVRADTPATDSETAAANAICTSMCDVVASEHREQSHVNNDIGEQHSTHGATESSSESSAVDNVPVALVSRIIYFRRSNGVQLKVVC